MCDTVVHTCRFSGKRRSGRVISPLQCVVHKRLGPGDPVTDHGAGQHETMHVEAFQPVVVLNSHFCRILVIHPDDLAATEQGQQLCVVRIGGMDRPFRVRGKVVEDQLLSPADTHVDRPKSREVDRRPKYRETLSEIAHPLMILIELRTTGERAEWQFFFDVDHER